MRYAFLGNGFRIVTGSVVRLSVAPYCGEYHWLIVPRYNLSFSHGSMMRISLYETFSFFNPFSFLLDVFRLQFNISFCGIASISVRILFFNPQIQFGIHHSSQTGIFVWENKSSAPSFSHWEILLVDDSFRDWMNCFRVCIKVEYLFIENILFLLNYIVSCSCAILLLFSAG